METYNQLTISIGRNINNEAMPAGDWYLFRRQLRDAITSAGGDIVADTTGAGVYDGIQEESAVFIALNIDNIEQLRADVAQLLQVYKQECAGFSLDLMPELLQARALKV